MLLRHLNPHRQAFHVQNTGLSDRKVMAENKENTDQIKHDQIKTSVHV